MRGALIGLPPLLVTAITFLVPFLATAAPTSAIGVASALLYIVVFFGWSADLYVSARFKLRGVETGKRLPRLWVFAGPPGVLIAAVVLQTLGFPLDDPSRPTWVAAIEGVLALAAIVAFLFSVSFAAEALLDVEGQNGNRKYSSLKTTLLVLYLPIGVFLLFERTRTLLSMPDATDGA